ncbi:MAG: NAD-dependent epimerase/dehydratase family protein [Henriciella sp.]|nr:NAD-dependent epimerase/dehydratase family protein [Henriciella sp.]
MQEPTATCRAGEGVVAVTGATGFIGSHLLSRFDGFGQPTRALVRHRRNRTIKVPGSTEIVPGSLQDREAISALLEGAHTCIHAAGATTSIDVNGFHSANVIGTFNMAACAATTGVDHFIYVSSQAARAPWISDYAASKAISETALDPFRSHMKITIIRPPAVIGPGDPMLQPMFDLMRSGWLPAPSDPRDEIREFAVISVHDLVDQIVASVYASDSVTEPVEPCSISATSWNQVALEASETLQHKVRLLPIWPGVLKTIGYLADGVSKLIRRPLPLSRGKARELLAADWTYEHPVSDAMSLREILRECFPDH